MRKSMLAACTAALFVASTVFAGAQTAPRPATTTAPPAAAAPAKPAPAAAKPATPAPAATDKKKPSEAQLKQQNKMKSCAKEWGDYKTKTGKSGKAEHQKFMSECLKK